MGNCFSGSNPAQKNSERVSGQLKSLKEQPWKPPAMILMDSEKVCVNSMKAGLAVLPLKEWGQNLFVQGVLT
jgi:hypothetical protein